MIFSKQPNFALIAIYTIQIKDYSKKTSIINMLKDLKEDYSFIEISENIKTLDAELEKRYKLFLKDSEGKDCINLKRELK